MGVFSSLGESEGFVNRVGYRIAYTYFGARVIGFAFSVLAVF